MRACPSWLVLLVVAAAAASAALAHVVIDVIADYLVAHASFDDVGSHRSRELIVTVAVVAAVIIAVRAFRLCCEAVTSRSVRAPEPPRWSLGAGFVLATVTLATGAVPVMEWIDTLLARKPLGDLDDAFGGSVMLGLVTVVLCAGAVAIVTFVLVRWLLSHRDRIIAAIVSTITKSHAAPASAAKLRSFVTVPLRRRSIASMRRGLRAPPHSAVLYQRTQTVNEVFYAPRALCGVLSRYGQRSYAVRRSNRPSIARFLRPQSVSHAKRRQGDIFRNLAAWSLRSYGERARIRYGYC